MPATISWPAHLPQVPLYDGNQVSFGRPVTEFQPDVDGGVPMQRERATASADRHQVSMALSADALRALRIFYKDTTRHGSMAFNMFDPYTSGFADFTFATAPTASGLSATTFRVSFELVRLP